MYRVHVQLVNSDEDVVYYDLIQAIDFVKGYRENGLIYGVIWNDDDNATMFISR